MTDPAPLIALLESGVCAVEIHHRDSDGTLPRYGMLNLDGSYVDVPAGTPIGDTLRYWSRHGHGNGDDIASRWETRGETVWRILFWWRRDWSDAK